MAPIAEAVDALVLSFEVGSVKPDERIWNVALDRLGAIAAETVFADDRADLVEAARRFGLDAFVVASSAALECELQTRGFLQRSSV